MSLKSIKSNTESREPEKKKKMIDKADGAISETIFCVSQQHYGSGSSGLTSFCNGGSTPDVDDKSQKLVVKLQICSSGPVNSDRGMFSSPQFHKHQRNHYAS
ncbi:uncharacterized [Tachysurus ichikawai]